MDTNKDRWCWDDLLERAFYQSEFLSQLHQNFIDAHPEMIPVCSCHPQTREARLKLKELREKE